MQETPPCALIGQKWLCRTFLAPYWLPLRLVTRLPALRRSLLLRRSFKSRGNVGGRSTRTRWVSNKFVLFLPKLTKWLGRKSAVWRDLVYAAEAAYTNCFMAADDLSRNAARVSSPVESRGKVTHLCIPVFALGNTLYFQILQVFFPLFECSVAAPHPKTHIRCLAPMSQTGNGAPPKCFWSRPTWRSRTSWMVPFGCSGASCARSRRGSEATASGSRYQHAPTLTIFRIYASKMRLYTWLTHPMCEEIVIP